MALFELNQVERRALRLAALLVVLGAAVRLGLGPGPEEYAWHPAAEGDASGALTTTRDGVAEALAREERAARPLEAGERIDLNRAPEEELRRLPGVGPARARAILAAREEAPFRSVDDITRVPGIGPAALRRIRDHLEVTPAPAPASRFGPGARTGAGGGVAAAARPAAAGQAGGGPLNINVADTISLRRLPGVGPSRAREIVRLRERLDGFRSVEELLEVPGIGPSTLERLRPLVRVD